MSLRNSRLAKKRLGRGISTGTTGTLTEEELKALLALGKLLSDEHGMMQELAEMYMSRAMVDGTFNLIGADVSVQSCTQRVVRTELESEQLQPVDSGLFVYSAESDGLVPFKRTLSLSGPKKAQQALNDVFAKAYYGCKVWEAQLTAKPPEGAGFLLYIDPQGGEVFFPLSWCFSERPPAFFLATTRTEEQAGTAFSYVNVYTSLAATENTALVPAYFRIYSDTAAKSDIAQPAQLVSFSDQRVTLSPETVDSTTQTLDTTVSSLTTEGAIPDTYGLENLVPAVVGVITLKSGQRIGRDESKWKPSEINAPLGCYLPPEFVPV